MAGHCAISIPFKPFTGNGTLTMTWSAPELGLHRVPHRGRAPVPAQLILYYPNKYTATCTKLFYTLIVITPF